MLWVLRRTKSPTRSGLRLSLSEIRPYMRYRCIFRYIWAIFSPCNFSHASAGSRIRMFVRILLSVCILLKSALLDWEKSSVMLDGSKYVFFVFWTIFLVSFTAFSVRDTLKSRGVTNSRASERNGKRLTFSAFLQTNDVWKDRNRVRRTFLVARTAAEESI